MSECDHDWIRVFTSTNHPQFECSKCHRYVSAVELVHMERLRIAELAAENDRLQGNLNEVLANEKALLKLHSKNKKELLKLRNRVEERDVVYTLESSDGIYVSYREHKKLKDDAARLREAAESLLDSVKPRYDLQHNKIVPDLYLDKLREALESSDE